MYNEKINELSEIKDRYANHLLFTGVLIGIIALLASLRVTLDRGWRLDNFIDAIGFLIILGIYLFRNHLRTDIKIWILIFCATAVGSVGLLTNSVISMFAPYFLLAAIFAVIFFDLRITLIVVTYQILFMVTVFLLKIKGIVTFENLDANYRAFSNTNWVNYLSTYLLFIVLIVILSHSFYDSIKQTTWTLKELNLQLKAEIIEKENAFQELRESNEAVAAAEDELRATNDELVNVNEELSKRNEELAKYKNYLEDKVKERTFQVQDLNKKLLETNINLLKSNQELTQQKEELASILNELKKAQAGLVHSEKMASLGVLAAGIAHEINNPINYINSGVYGLETLISALLEYINDIKKNHPVGNSENEIAREKELIEITNSAYQLLEHIHMGVERSSSIIKSLKIFSFSGVNTQEYVNIHEGLDATIVMLNYLVKNRIIIKKEYGQIPLIQCNSSQINQVFMNLVSNAIEAISENGEIQIKTFTNETKHCVVISISDNGEGIPPLIQKRIYEPFFTTKDVGKGTGMGLAISYNIIKEHNGDLYFETIPGEGTTFHIELPIS
jgi:signal transduction histidine kinase